MMYMLTVDILVASIVFGLAGVCILALFVWTEAKEYADALRVMHRIAWSRRREVFAISRIRSRNHNTDPFRAAVNSRD
jgi:hypothetical protein